MEDVYLGMIIKRLNVSIQNYMSHCLAQRPPWDIKDKPVEEKTALLLNSDIANIFFLYEGNHLNFNHYWNILVTKVSKEV